MGELVVSHKNIIDKDTRGLRVVLVDFEPGIDKKTLF